MVLIKEQSRTKMRTELNTLFSLTHTAACLILMSEWDRWDNLLPEEACTQPFWVTTLSLLVVGSLFIGAFYMFTIITYDWLPTPAAFYLLPMEGYQYIIPMICSCCPSRPLVHTPCKHSTTHYLWHIQTQNSKVWQQSYKQTGTVIS